MTSADVGYAVSQSNALLPSGELITPRFDANVYTNAIARRVRDIGDGVLKLATQRDDIRPVIDDLPVAGWDGGWQC